MFFVKSSIVISSLCTILLLSEDSEVEEAEIEVVLWKTKSIDRKDKLGNRLQVIWIYCPKTQTGLTPFSCIHLLSNGLCSF
jgi:hypothetical protein